MVALASVIAIPIGIGVAVWLVEYGRNSVFANIVRFFIDVLTGVPSIVFGLFVYIVLIVGTGTQLRRLEGLDRPRAADAAGRVRSAEVILNLVPNGLRESALALGAPRWRVVGRIVLPTALPGMVTGILLAVARAAGETAPLLFTAAYTHETTTNLGSFMNSLPGADLHRRDLSDPAGRRTRLGGRAHARGDDPAPQPDRSTSLAKEPPSMSSTRPEEHDRPRPRQQLRRPLAPSAEQAPCAERPRDDRAAREARRHARRSRAQPTRVGVKLEGLRAFYGDAEQVKGIDLEFKPNEVTAIIGPSGCGKSTMVRCINRMHEEIPGARAEGRVLLGRRGRLWLRRSTWWPCAARSGWSSRNRTPSRRCRSSTTSPPACA